MSEQKMHASLIHRTARSGARTALFAAALGCSAAACGSADSEVYGTAMVVAVPEDDSTPQGVPWPWTGRSIEAIVGSGAEERILSTTVDESGAFRIAGVPAGPFWLAYPAEGAQGIYEGKIYLRTSRRGFDLSSRTAAFLGGLGTRLQIPVRLTGLAPIEKDDVLQLIADHAAASWGATPVGAEESAGSLGGFVSSRRYPTERITALQGRKLVDSGVDWLTVVRGGSVLSPNAGAASLVVPLTAAPAGKLRLSLDAGAFFRSLAPLATADLRFIVNVSARRPAPNSQVGLPIWLAYATAPSSAAAGLALVERDYVDPGPASWSRRYQVRYVIGREYDVPGAPTARASCGSSVEVSGDLAELAAAPLRPRVSLPRRLEMGDQNASDAPFSVGPTPTVRWQAPAEGTVDFYRLDLVELRQEKSAVTPGVPAASFLTTETELTLPAEVLKEGASYYVELIAVSGSSVSLQAAPRQASPLDSVAGRSHLCSASFKVE